MKVEPIMGIKWKKLKLLLGKKLCIMSSSDPNHGFGEFGASEADLFDRNFSPNITTSGRRRGFLSRSSSVSATINTSQMHSAPLRSTLSCASVISENRTSGTHISKSSCSICLEALKPGDGQALFTAECSHTFHFSCIAANVRYGNLVCPICRARWKDVPWQAGRDALRSGSHRRAPSAGPRLLTEFGQIDLTNASGEERRRRNLSFQHMGDSLAQSFHSHEEPDIYNDDESLSQPIASNVNAVDVNGPRPQSNKVAISAYSEISSVPACESLQCFTVLIHVKAPPASGDVCESSRIQDVTSSSSPRGGPRSRAPLDLVAVLDISGSMAGRKLVLLKQAMGFVVQNLGSADRLSVVVFSSSAKRVFPLQKMGEEGQRQAIQAMDALIATGGTNIAEGLKKGVKILEDRREKNPISSIMLLSDGQDTYSMSSGRQLPFLLGGGTTADSRRLVPRSIRRSTSLGHLQIPIHTFGFGSDHDAATMHAISEVSGGTFSFIQAEEVVQDAFAQCIGGLLSVVAQDVELSISCSSPGVHINAIHAGSYHSSVRDEGTHGVVRLGDLYAEEERDVLVELKLPVFTTQSEGATSMSLVQAMCIYKDPVTRAVSRIAADELCLLRPLASEEAQQVVSLEVDRQRNRLQTAEVIAVARSLADEGNFEAAQSHLRSARTQLEISPSARAGDQLCNVLDSELKEMHERMASRQLYERSGRAYLLSAQSSHLRQRATTRGDSLDGLMHDYQTQSMVDMVTLSQTRSLLERNMTVVLPSAAHKDASQESNVSAPSRSSSRSLLQRFSAKVCRSYAGA